MANPNLAPFDLDPSNVCITCKDAYNKTIRKTIKNSVHQETQKSTTLHVLKYNFRVAIEN